MSTRDRGRLVQGYRSQVTRRSFLQKTLRWGLVAGTTLSTLVLEGGRASAATCSVVGMVPNFGNQCETSTPPCDAVHASHCNNGNCANTARPRCDYWGPQGTGGPGGEPNGQYCWCSTIGCHNGFKGHWTCCDCWDGPGSGVCGNKNGDISCACKQFHPNTTTC